MLGYLEAVFLKKTRMYNKIDCFIAPSRFVYEMHQRSAFAESQLLFLRNFSAIDMLQKNAAENDGYLLFLGRLSPEKGIMTLLRAIKEVPNAELQIAGDGPQRGAIEAFIQDNAIGDRVKLLGFQAKDDMMDIISRCMAVVMPSEWYENCPYSIIEAQMQGKPVIGSNIGGIPELIEDGQTGFVFDAFSEHGLAECIHTLLNMEEREYAKMCERVIESARKEYDASAYYVKLMEMYQELQSGREVQS